MRIIRLQSLFYRYRASWTKNRDWLLNVAEAGYCRLGFIVLAFGISRPSGARYCYGLETAWKVPATRTCLVRELILKNPIRAARTKAMRANHGVH
jgi:hypothetical protein